jgi:hypothetical protein
VGIRHVKPYTGITLGWAVRAKFKSRLITDEDEVAIFVG